MPWKPSKKTTSIFLLSYNVNVVQLQSYLCYGLDFRYIFLKIVQSLSRVWCLVTPWPAALQASPSFAISRRLLKLMSFESAVPFSHLILCCPLLKLFIKYLYVFIWFLALLGLPRCSGPPLAVARSRGSSPGGCVPLPVKLLLLHRTGSGCTGFNSWCAWLSCLASQASEHRVSSHGAQA